MTHRLIHKPTQKEQLYSTVKVNLQVVSWGERTNAIECFQNNTSLKKNTRENVVFSVQIDVYYHLSCTCWSPAAVNAAQR